MLGVGRKLGYEECLMITAATIILAVFYWALVVDDLKPIRSNIVTQPYNLQVHYADLATTIDVPLHPVNQMPQHREDRQQGKVAICVVGELRAFELTGPSIKKYLLDVYPDADVFVHAPVDEDVHKLILWTDVPHLASARLFFPTLLNESLLVREVLRAKGSPHGLQGLLQYFTLVEGCLSLIEDYETKHDFKYDWVIRTRLDSYWNGPMPPVESFNPSTYHVPDGSSYGGLNDRLGIGNRETSRVALQRMSLLPAIHHLGFRGLNSEKSFQAQFKANHVPVESSTFYFCVLSTKTYSVPVASILSKGPLNGVKCRPCTAPLKGGNEWKALKARQYSGGRPGRTDDSQLCDASTGLEANWERIYDRASGPEMAELRQKMSNLSLDECIRDILLFQKKWKVWSAPPAEKLCTGLHTVL